jgi:hypothetical protein
LKAETVQLSARREKRSRSRQSSNHSGNAKFKDELDLKASKAYADSLVVGLIDDREIMTHQQIHFRQRVDPERRARF